MGSKPENEKKYNKLYSGDEESAKKIIDKYVLFEIAFDELYDEVCKQITDKKQKSRFKKALVAGFAEIYVEVHLIELEFPNLIEYRKNKKNT